LILISPASTMSLKLTVSLLSPKVPFTLISYSFASEEFVEYTVKVRDDDENVMSCEGRAADDERVAVYVKEYEKPQVEGLIDQLEKENVWEAPLIV